MTIKSSLALVAAIFATINLTSGCGVVVGLADSKQRPPTIAYASKQSSDRVFTAAVQGMSKFGKLLSQDRSSGVVQGQKGDWVMNVAIAQASAGSGIEVSARYVPSNQFDFNSREKLTADLVAAIESSLGDKLVAAKQ